MARERRHFVVLQILRPRLARNRELLEHLDRGRPTNAIDVGQRNVDALLVWDVDSEEAWHVTYSIPLFAEGLLALPLLVAGIVAANDANDTAASHDLAVLADATNAGSDFHGCSLHQGLVSVGRFAFC